MSDTTGLLNKSNIELVRADLSKRESLQEVVQGVGAVYHLAFDYARPEIDDTHNLLEACLSNGVQRFVYFSSLAVVGLSDVRDVISEKTPCRPDTSYGKRKLCAERALLEAHAKYGFPVVVVRPTSVYGIGETNFWLPLFQAIHGRRLSRLFGDGSNLLSLCFIDNLIDAVLLAEQLEAATGRVYIISDEMPYTFREVVGAIADACHVPEPRSSIPRRLALPVAQLFDYLCRLQLMEPVVPFLSGNVARWTAHYPCSIAKARAELGFQPRIGLREGVCRTAEWYRENGHLWHSLPWSEGALDMSALAEPSHAWPNRTLRAAYRTLRLVWNVAALSWRLPAKVARRVRRRVEQSRV
jgi:nucleoside-diphosphate-sugar epimerase